MKTMYVIKCSKDGGTQSMRGGRKDGWGTGAYDELSLSQSLPTSQRNSIAPPLAPPGLQEFSRPAAAWDRVVSESLDW